MFREVHLYRSYGNIDYEDRKNELVVVGYGKDIYDATDSLIRIVSDDLSEMSEYIGCKTTAFAPEIVQSFRKVKRYKLVFKEVFLILHLCISTLYPRDRMYAEATKIYK